MPALLKNKHLNPKGSYRVFTLEVYVSNKYLNIYNIHFHIILLFKTENIRFNLRNFFLWYRDVLGKGHVFCWGPLEFTYGVNSFLEISMYLITYYESSTRPEMALFYLKCVKPILSDLWIAGRLHLWMTALQIKQLL